MNTVILFLDIRPVDMFRIFDKNNSQEISRDQFIQGLKKVRTPLDDYEMYSLLNKLDPSKIGKISYRRLMEAVKDQRKVSAVPKKCREAILLKYNHISKSFGIRFWERPRWARSRCSD